jgi:hypothetical protein
MKTSKDRVAALRERAAAHGLKRREIYAHEDDWPAIKALAEKLQKRRGKAAKVAANAEVRGDAPIYGAAPLTTDGLCNGGEK